jgi:hypothetical protein
MSTLIELEDLVQKLSLVKEHLSELAAQEKDVQEIRRDLETQIMQHLKDAGTTGYLSKHGRVDIRSSMSFKTPKDNEQKKALFDYIKAYGDDVYLSLLSVNSQTLNAWAKTEIEYATKEGKFPFAIPGLDEPISYETIAFRKK